MASADVVLSPENKAFTLVTRKNLRDNDAKKVTHLASIEKATGVTGWTFDYEGDAAALEAGLTGMFFILNLFLYPYFYIFSMRFCKSYLY